LIHLPSLSIGCNPFYRFLDTNNANAYQIRTFVLIFLPLQNGNLGVNFLPVYYSVIKNNFDILLLEIIQIIPTNLRHMYPHNNNSDTLDDAKSNCRTNDQSKDI